MALASREKCDLGHYRVPEIYSDTRPFRIDEGGTRKLLIMATQSQPSTFPVPLESFK
jgi:hypothetical protein